MTRTEMEDRIKLRSWGLWANPRYVKMLGAKPPAWTKLVQIGYRETKHLPEPISDGEAMEIDAVIASLCLARRQILFERYMYCQTIRDIAEMWDCSRRQAYNKIDDAVGAVYKTLFPGDCMEEQAVNKYSTTY